MSKVIDFNGLIKEVGKCCLTEKNCGTCYKEECFIGYCEQCLITCLKNQDEFIDEGIDNIPYEDTKIFDEELIISAIAFALKQCKNCQLYHDEECIINIVRSALEVALIGEHLDYKGSNFIYFSDLQAKNKDIAQKVYDTFKSL
ncbi:hypothetical protein KQI42_00740 [Tissierella sp. MSJ-40]|uniref:Uncharacterized protein n=1 Tax=Tissierella simiarum TaxID=2841534 RepID=A0ABS6E245_9FIRM|nr:hypothetical protein [Tissierella simiarum]MBU5436510.1 hypothetical protein [Tissierella simiarum]